MSTRAGSRQGPWQIKRVRSTTGTKTDEMAWSIFSPYNYENQTEILWIYPTWNITNNPIKRKFNKHLDEDQYQEKSYTNSFDSRGWEKSSGSSIDYQEGRREDC